MEVDHARGVCRNRVTTVGLKGDQEALGRVLFATAEFNQSLIGSSDVGLNGRRGGIAPG